MSELMEALEPRRLLAGSSFDAPEVPITFANVNITLLQDEAPRAVKSFLELRDQGKLKDVIIHKAAPGANAARAGLFRETTDGLEFTPRTKRIDGGRSLPTVAGTVGFMRDPDDPGRTTGEIVFNLEDRAGARSGMVVFGTFSELTEWQLIFNLSGIEDVERSELLTTVPGGFGSTFENVNFISFDLGRIGGSRTIRRLGGLANNRSAEWLRLSNPSDQSRTYEVQLSFASAENNAIGSRGVLEAGETRLLRLHVGRELRNVDRTEYFDLADEQAQPVSHVRVREAYAITIHTGGGVVGALERLERNREFETVIPMSIGANRQATTGQRDFEPFRIENTGAMSRVLVHAWGGSKIIRIVARSDGGDVVRIERAVPAGQTMQIRLDRIEELQGSVVQLRIRRSSGGRFSLLVIDGRRDFSEENTVGILRPSDRSSFFQAQLHAGVPVEMIIFNTSKSVHMWEAEVSLVACERPILCPDDPPGLPTIEPFEVPARSTVSFPVDGEPLVFDEAFFLRLIRHGRGRFFVYVDPRDLDVLV